MTLTVAIVFAEHKSEPVNDFKTAVSELSPLLHSAARLAKIANAIVAATAKEANFRTSVLVF